MTELEKYQGIYSSEQYARYGHTNHGKGILATIASLKNLTSLVDVGCGHNEFIHELWKLRRDIIATGVDFACPSADIIAPANALPFKYQQFSMLTAFDMLEHLTEAEVIPTLEEFARVSSAFCFSISYVPSKIKWKGETLHPTVKPEEWWIDAIRTAGGVEIHKEGKYILGSWKRPCGILKLTCPVALDANCVLVGNGPSLLWHPIGRVIDAFDEVIRFNTYRIRDYEPATGTRTTLWATFGRGCLPQDESERPRRVIFCYGEDGTPAYTPEFLWRIPSPFRITLQNQIREAWQGDETGRAKLMPSNGFLVACWLLSMGVSRLHLAGFDHFVKNEMSKQHHYWNPGSWGIPKEHWGEYESTQLGDLARQGKICYIT